MAEDNSPRGFALRVEKFQNKDSGEKAEFLFLL